MKKIFILLLILPSLSWGALTQAQLDQIKKTTNDMGNTVTQMRDLVLALQPLVAGGNTFQLSFSTNTVNLTASQLQDIVNYYTGLKGTLAAEYNTLP